VGLFRRQKDLLSKQREELGLDRLDDPVKQAPRPLAPEARPPSELDQFWRSNPDQVIWQGGRRVTVTSRRRPGWGRFFGILRLFAITVVAVSWVLVRQGVSTGIALAGAAIVGLGVAAVLGRSSRVRVKTVQVSRRSPGPPAGDQPADPDGQ
jgi:hypothetical protein